MPMPRALTEQQMKQAAELYLEGKSRRQVAAIFKRSEAAVVTALRYMRVSFRPQSEAAAEHNRSRRGFYRRSQLVTSVFDMGAK